MGEGGRGPVRGRMRGEACRGMPGERGGTAVLSPHQSCFADSFSPRGEACWRGLQAFPRSPVRSTADNIRPASPAARRGCPPPQCRRWPSTEDAVGVLDGRQAVGNRQRCAALRQFVKALAAPESRSRCPGHLWPRPTAGCAGSSKRRGQSRGAASARRRA